MRTIPNNLEWGIYTFLSYARDSSLAGPRLETVTTLFVLGGRSHRRSDCRAERCGVSTPRANLDIAWRGLRAVFLVLTPGYGVQYAVSILPLLFVVDVARAVLYSTLTGIMLAFIYTAQMSPQWPLHGMVPYSVPEGRRVVWHLGLGGAHLFFGGDLATYGTTNA